MLHILQQIILSVTIVLHIGQLQLSSWERVVAFGTLDFAVFDEFAVFVISPGLLPQDEGMFLLLSCIISLALFKAASKGSRGWDSGKIFSPLEARFFFCFPRRFFRNDSSFNIFVHVF